MKKRILVVDDDPLLRETLNLILARAGYQVLLAEDGHSGVRKAHTERPALVLIDGLLPGIHGFHACKAIKELAAPPKVIMLTGVYTKVNYRWEVKEHYGADDLLIKPVKTAELLACIEKHLADAVDLPMAAPTIERPSQTY